MNIRLLFCLLLIYAGKVIAANDAVTVSDVTVPQGGSTDLVIVLNNETANLSGWQCDLKFSDENLSLKLNASGKPMTSLGTRFDTTEHTITSMVKSTGYGFVGVSMSQEAIPENSGTLFSVTLEADASLEVGATYEGTLSKIEFYTNEQTPQTVLFDDMTFTVTIGEPSDNRILLDENSTSAPTPATGVDVRVQRTINAGVWSTICLPFAMTEEQVKTAFGNDVQLAEFTGYEATENNDGDIVEIKVNFSDATAIEANHPCLIKVSENVSEFTVDGVDIDPEEEPTVAAVKRTRKQWSEMVGTYAATTVEDQMLFLNGNKFWYSTGSSKIKGYRAYFDFYDVLTEVESSSSRVSMFFNGEITDINKVSEKKAGTSGAVYDLQGRRVNKPIKGIFIKDGKKIVIEN